ncbi:putative transposase/invertase (TIGR01784 family) [Virgibacillus natechei]|uniref:Transposase/invertase (TIGR01784 family) n=1 Tax=Virgibacillus natechei TaxID=1216297 RepID=A0ABS4IKH6_9BACI|nr:putative transposase/invertase (TIGR01784 family) [Virgibacillus natechei]
MYREFEWDKKWKKKGIEEGKLKAQLRIALNLLSKGMPLNEVAEITGLLLNKLKQLGN